ncbi:unnamed protein product [Gongylonema pulchrum]|uniref:Uncharacterized protein n=1 Tax=Gongylonema pulchrum TaxID=637853 RepID=A0A183DSJ8_9BILA|nr:unnamed protein product [Gongylonema pulchrum]
MPHKLRRNVQLRRQVENPNAAAESIYDRSRYPSCRFANCQSEQYENNWLEHENLFQFEQSRNEQQFSTYIMHYESRYRNIYMYPVASLNALDGHLERLQEEERERQRQHPEEIETNFYIPVVKNNYGQYQYLITDNETVWQFINNLTQSGHWAEPRNRVMWSALERQYFVALRHASRAAMSHNVRRLNAQPSQTPSPTQPAGQLTINVAVLMLPNELTLLSRNNGSGAINAAIYRRIQRIRAKAGVNAQSPFPTSPHVFSSRPLSTLKITTGG